MLRSLLALTPLLAAGLAVAEDAVPARLLETRAGHTSRGATRVVFQMDRPVEYLVVELPTENGVEVHLLGVDTTALPAAHTVRDGHISEISFRAGQSGLVARLNGGSVRVSARSFDLPGPDRVVVDLYPEVTAKPLSPKITSAPAVSSKSPVMPVADTARPARTPTEDPAPTGPAASVGDADDAIAMAEETASALEDSTLSGTEPQDEAEFSDLLAWIQILQVNVKALNHAEDEVERAKYRRSLAFLLARRGLNHEAEKALTLALSSDGYARKTAVSDSVHLAELRFRNGDTEGASEAARSIDVARATPFQQIRLANILLEADFPALAVDLLVDARKRTNGAPHARATLLLARAHWDGNEPEPALALARELTSGGEAPDGTVASALILEADCLVTLDRAASARPVYERAAHLTVSDEEASWIGLQLGNLARREGHHDEAITRYRETVERWPDTFYASQAEWFLRVAQQLEALRQAEAARG